VIGDSDGRQYQPVQLDERARILRENLLAIQERRVADPYGWISEVPPLRRQAPQASGRQSAILSR